MREIFDLLNSKEKRVIALLGLLMIITLCVLVFVSFPKRKKYYSSLRDIEKKEKVLQQAELLRDKKENELFQWKEAQSDIKEVKSKYLYRGIKSIEKIRLDLQKIFEKNKLVVPQLDFSYVSFEKRDIEKLAITFEFRGTYKTLKALIYSVEDFPRFLCIERIDFLDIDSERNQLTLRIHMAGYYEK
ncbi:MAG: hypothetical protein ACOC6P_01790 [Candidatus Aminicenantaceae bacterium]